ncbi:MAG: hypothetical protein WBE57_21850, partial [Xanthobacteraceae bacterium]
MSRAIAHIATGRTAIGLVGALCFAFGLSGQGGLFTPPPALAFDGTTTPATASVTPSDSLRASA